MLCCGARGRDRCLHVVAASDAAHRCQPLRDEVCSGPSSVPFRSGKHYPCGYGEARLVGGQVVGILYIGAPPRKGQLSLDL